jgi:hypothetical protein
MRPPPPGKGAFRLAIVALLFLAAPTPGDIGSCNQGVGDLDPVKFFSGKQDIDCEKCQECGFTTHACTLACSTTLEASTFPVGCEPVEQDGEVCLDALQATGCTGYASFVADQGATAPTECDFCPPRDAGAAE